LFALSSFISCFCFFFNPPPPTMTYTLSLHDALPIYLRSHAVDWPRLGRGSRGRRSARAVPSVVPPRQIPRGDRPPRSRRQGLPLHVYARRDRRARNADGLRPLVPHPRPHRGPSVRAALRGSRRT